MISRKQMGLVMLPFLFLTVFFYVSLKKDMAISLTPAENEIYSYRTDTVLTDSFIKKRTSLDISAGLSGPLYVEQRSVSGTDRPGAEKGYVVSLILISRNERRAIINNAIVGEGDILDNRKISRIEKDKVGITLNGMTTWVKLEEP
ncbi:MAG: hypothetical protein CO150_06335 [Nitrospirae bacterium CG_4_9_14_3_um_filter_53_35]|nr:MAG: hypothetical protein AUK29_02860 [Nitrospirae bacterium CG2_30_53_67]PIS36565.1 MAG: hypothetical protein COT35_10470 [Nitrospirae bacterium CG08_land_8_20_14_0_20_52_24]PIV85522.1 MAG: hypothetical protein COW52_01815 [Nitrospirae bacterium CG17_big_fil_post_rev_8_21_14_2_50_50_9]PIW85188.1 MAG: hypothetical protein COZ95_05885 [Nitrospirae bacterium CG_4_8_14_3_um_filter_50_41]PIX84541.1 MAG: hypothetical protein COZ32_13080 [Nitrospirae bacterium CG_4_10_14_3_um_filter_53_41]PJA7457